MNSKLLGFIGALIALILTGCAGASPTQPPIQNYPGPVNDASSQAFNNRSVLGLWEVTIDTETFEYEIKPMRFGAFHLNIRQFLEDGPCTDCFSIVPPIQIQPYGFDVRLSIRHPIPGNSMYTVFDVRGIMMLPGTFIFPGSDLLTTRAATGDWAILDPDGWTTIFNAVDYPGPGIFGYSIGKFVNPDWGDPTNTLNPFMAYYSEGQSEDVGGRRAFFTDDTITRTWKFNAGGQQLKFWYAIDACWDIPEGVDPYELDDFPISANCVEPYRFDIEFLYGGLWENGGTVTIGVDIYDHQGWSEPWALIYEAPECFDGVNAIITAPDSINGEIAHWDFSVTNFKGGLNMETGVELLVTYGNPDPDPVIGTINGYARFTIPLGDDPVPPPVVDSISISVVVLDDVVDNALIVGHYFADGCTVRLEQSGEPDIIGFDVAYTDNQNITADFDFTGSALGFWDVVVKNPDTQEGILPEGLNVIGCNSSMYTNLIGESDFTGGTHMPAFDACFVHDTGTLADGEFMSYISGFGGTVCTTVIIDTLVPEEGHGLSGSDWGNPQITYLPVPISIDIAEETGWFFITWNTNYSVVEAWSASTGRFDGFTDASNTGQVFCLDTDGHGGFWNAYFPEYGFAPGIKHFTPDGPQPGTLIENVVDHISLPEVWGTPTEIIVIPDQFLLVLSAADSGKVRLYNIEESPPIFLDEISELFDGEIVTAEYPVKTCDMVADFSYPDLAGCRIIIFADMVDGGVQLVRIDTDLKILAGPVTIPTKHYYSIDINPDTGDLALWPDIDWGPGKYALIEQPFDW